MALTEGKHTAEFLLSEGNGSISREQGVLRSESGALAAGTLLGKVTATGELSAYNNADSPVGVGVAVGVLYANAADSTADQKVTYIARDAEVIGSELTGLDATGRTDLAALGIACSVGEGGLFVDVFDRDQAFELKRIVHHQQAL